jgi:anti-sigma B factor antagonist
MGMLWSSSVAKDALVGAPQGRVDEGSWETFLAHLVAAVGQAADAGKRLVVDMAELDYMSSRGLRALTIARREADAKKVDVILARPNARMREILAISRYDKIFKVIDTIDAAS